MVHQELAVLRVHQDLQEPQVQVVRLVQAEVQVLQGLVDHQELRVHQELVDQVVHQELVDQVVHQELVVLQELRLFGKVLGKLVQHIRLMMLLNIKVVHI